MSQEVSLFYFLEHFFLLQVNYFGFSVHSYQTWRYLMEPDGTCMAKSVYTICNCTIICCRDMAVCRGIPYRTQKSWNRQDLLSSQSVNTNCQHHHKDTTPHQRCILYVWFRTSPCNLRYRSSSTPSQLPNVTQSPKYLVSSVVLGQLLLQQISKFLCSTWTESRVCTLASYIAVLQKEQSLNLLTILCLSLRVGRRFLTIPGWQMTSSRNNSS